METKNEESPLKIRSAKATIAAGLRLYIGNFRRIFRATWLPVLVSALVCAFATRATIAATSQMIQLLGLQARADAPTLPQQYMAQTGLALLDLIISVVLMSYVFEMLTIHRTEGVIPYPKHWWSLPDRHSLTRTVASAVVWLLTQVVFGIILLVPAYFGITNQSVTLLGVGFLLLLVFTVLILPLVYPHIRYLTTKDTHILPLLRSCYGQGMRHWGYIFTVLFVMLLLLIIAMTITMLPAVVLIMASIYSQVGADMGDPLGMPSYMDWLALLVFTLSGFILAYVIIAIHFPAYYMAGSIEQQEIQRNETGSIEQQEIQRNETAKDTLY